jgi:hypothetical protein
MTHHATGIVGRSAVAPHRCRVVRCGAGLLAVAVILAGCGGSSPSATGQAAASSVPSSTQIRQQTIAFASCMRSHGVPGYPDPRVTSSPGQVHVRITPGGANPNSPAFKSADAACHHLLPYGGAPQAGHSAQARAQEVKFADCMRAHGVPNFPDPSRDGAFDLPSGVDQQAPRFKQAEQACANVEPSSLTINQAG